MYEKAKYCKFVSKPNNMHSMSYVKKYLATGQFGTGQFGTKSIWHHDNIAPYNLVPGQFGTRTVWHHDNLSARFDCRQICTKNIWGQDNLVSGKFRH